MPLFILALIGIGGSYWLYRTTQPTYKLTFSSSTGNTYLEDTKHNVALAIMHGDGKYHAEDAAAGLGHIQRTSQTGNGDVTVTIQAPDGSISSVIVPATNVVNT